MAILKILCAIDFSEGARNALHNAAELVRKAQALLVILHVAEDDPRRVLRETSDEAEAKLASWKHEAQRRGAADVVTRLRFGVPWEQIVAAAREDPLIDLVVLGTHGGSGVERSEIGSVAERVVDASPCSVMVVRVRQRTGRAG